METLQLGHSPGGPPTGSAEEPWAAVAQAIASDTDWTPTLAGRKRGRRGSEALAALTHATRMMRECMRRATESGRSRSRREGRGTRQSLTRARTSRDRGSSCRESPDSARRPSIGKAGAHGRATQAPTKTTGTRRRMPGTDADESGEGWPMQDASRSSGTPSPARKRWRRRGTVGMTDLTSPMGSGGRAGAPHGPRGHRSPSLCVPSDDRAFKNAPAMYARVKDCLRPVRPE